MLTAKDLEKYHQAAERILNAMDNSPVPISWHEMDRMAWADIACLPGFDKQEFRAKFPGLSADEENLAWTKYISDMVFALRAECEKTPILMDMQARENSVLPFVSGWIL